MMREVGQIGTRRRRGLPRVGHPRAAVDLLLKFAEQLDVSEKAIVRHTSGIYDELGLGSNAADHRRVLAVVRYLSA
jgi:hypothetical protein